MIAIPVSDIDIGEFPPRGDPADPGNQLLGLLYGYRSVDEDCLCGRVDESAGDGRPEAFFAIGGFEGGWRGNIDS